MHRTILALSLALVATTTRADEPPPVPDGGLVHEENEPCVDHVFALEGTCYYSRDVKNNRYMAFYVGDMGMVIYQLVNGEYVEIWRRSPDV